MFITRLVVRNNMINLKISDIKCSELPFKKFYVKFVVDGQIRQTSIRKNILKPYWRSQTTWDDILHFAVSDGSKLSIQVYQIKWSGNQLKGQVEKDISSLLDERPRTVEDYLIIPGTRGTSSHKKPPCITFSVAFLETYRSAEECQLPEAILQAETHYPHAIPQSLETISGIVDNIDPQLAAVESTVGLWTPLLNKLQMFTGIVDGISEVHPYAKIIWTVLSAAHKIVLHQAQRDQSIEDLIKTIYETFECLNTVDVLREDKRHQKTIFKIVHQTVECAYFIRDYSYNKNFWIKAVKHTISDVDRIIREYKDTFSQLRGELDGDAVINTEITVQRILRSNNSVAMNIDLNDMPYAKGAGHNPEKECLPNTRLDIINEIVKWACSQANDTCLCWLHGVAGSGKSSIAHSIASVFKKQRRLGSFFAFDIAHQDRSPNALFSTITRGIADLDDEWERSLWDIVKDDRSLRTTSSVRQQFDEFILRLSTTASLRIIGPIVVIIDALDECGDEESREAILHALGNSEKMGTLPSNLRIVLTSRPEPDIVRGLFQKSHVYNKSMTSIDEASTYEDLSAFVMSQLYDLSLKSDQDWPYNWCRTLARKSESLFQWASTACSFIKGLKVAPGRTPIERLDLILSTSVTTLDSLYSTVLKTTFTDVSDNMSMNRFRTITSMVLFAMEPLTIFSLQDLCDGFVPPDVVNCILEPLGSLLTGVESHGTPVKPLHTSFHDFLTDPKRGGSFYIDPSSAHRTLALGCLHVMQRGLRFNICGLESSHLMNREISDLALRVKTKIPPHLHYACYFWMDHLKKTPVETSIAVQVRQFLQKCFLYWVEAMSLKGELHSVKATLISLHDSLWHKDDSTGLSVFISEAMTFLERFEWPIKKSAPHIYISALPFERKDSSIYKTFMPLFPNTLSVDYNVETHRSDWYEIQDHSFSSDGRRVLCLTDSNKLVLCNTATGDIVTTLDEPIPNGHTSSIAYCPDGSCLSAVYQNIRSIRLHLWATADATPTKFLEDIGCYGLIPPSVAVKSLKRATFSPDGRYFAASGDAIHLWDLSHLRLPPRTCCFPHYSNLLMFSADSTRIISVSFPVPDINNVRTPKIDIATWDLADLDSSTRLSFEVAREYFSFAISSLGRYLATAEDESIFLWDTERNNDRSRLYYHPSASENTYSKKISFSPDDSHIASVDGLEVGIWDRKTCDLIRFLRLPSIFRHIKFLPDHTHILLVSPNGLLQKINYMDDEQVEGCNLLYRIPGVPWAEFDTPWISKGTVILGGLFRFGIRALDLSKFVHGTHWTECRGNTSNGAAGVSS